MTIEKHNFEMKPNIKKTTLSDRNYLIRNQPKPKYLTHDIVIKFIEESISDEAIKERMLAKLKKCPDGALQKFIDNFESKISAIISEISPKKEKKDLPSGPKEITIKDMIAMRNSLSDQSNKEFENESSPDWNCLWW